MSYAAAVDRLQALGLELAPSVPRRKFDLAHMRILAAALGDPQKQFPAILIAGTNGKGSTAATLAAILAAAGYRAGLYTSPHLARITERIRIADPTQPSPRSEQPGHHSEPILAQNLSISSLPSNTQHPAPSPCFNEIPEDAFARLYFRVDDAAQALVSTGQLAHHPSFFESLTALAFLYFAEQNLDIAVLEVGLGGRLDATNIVDPILSIITDIALDHQDYLGNTIAEIAREKAGILRPNGTLITLPQHPEANQAIGEAAIALNVHAINAANYLPARVSEIGCDFTPGVTGEKSIRALAPEVTPPLPPNHYDLILNREILKVRSPLSGQHQQRNIALALAAAIQLLAGSSNFEPPSHLAPPSNLAPRTSNPFPAIEAGIAHTSWPGRLEFLPPNLLLDVAHNPAGAWTLRAAIATLPEDQPRTLIFSCLRDKDLTEMAQILFPLFDPPPQARPPAGARPPQEARHSGAARTSVLAFRPSHRATSNPEPRPSNHIVLTPIDNPRAASLEALLAAARALDIPAYPAEGPAEALALARSLTPPGGLIVATGSIYLIGTLREAALTFD